MLPKITVVVPTRERLPVLKFCLQTILAQNYQKLEILVSDNCSVDGTGDFVRGLADPRIRYVNTGRRVSMTENWEYALSHIDDGWVTFLGDDDGLIPGSIESLAAIIRSTDCEAITYRACNYVWPGQSGSDIGRLIVPFPRGRETRNTADWLQRAMDGRADYSDLPIIYVLGIVSVDLVKRVKSRGQRFFNSRIPDIYASIALARSIKTYLFVNQPFAIIGSSRFSHGASYLEEGGRVTETGEAHRFLVEATIPFHPEIPLRRDGGLPPAAQIYVYEAYLQSRFLDPGSGVAAATPARQLELTLARPYVSHRFEDANQEWGRDFARQHGLDFEAALTRSERIRRGDGFANAVRRLRLAFECLVIYDRSVPLENVYAASVVAGAVRWLQPSPFFRFRQALRRLRSRAVDEPAESRLTQTLTFRRVWRDLRRS